MRLRPMVWHADAIFQVEETKALAARLENLAKALELLVIRLLIVYHWSLG